MAGGFNLKEVKEKSLRASIVFAGETLEFRYKPGAIDEDWFKLAQEAQESDDLEKLIQTMCACLTTWNMEVDGKPVPLEAEKIYELKPPIFLLSMINQKVQEESQNGGKAAKKPR